MNLDLIRSQSIAQYSSLFSNTKVLEAIKSATKNDKTGKFTSLLENLEKLNQSIEEANSENGTNISEPNENLGLLKSMNNNESVDNVDTSMREAINQLIADAELMEAMLDLEVTPPTDELFDLLAKFREIINKLDQEMRKVQEDVKSKKTKEEFKLTPSSDTKSGFAESISLVAK